MAVVLPLELQPHQQPLASGVRLAERETPNGWGGRKHCTIEQRDDPALKGLCWKLLRNPHNLTPA